MEEIILHAEKREELTKGQLKSKRRENKIPAIVYGEKQTPIPLFVERRQFEKVIRTSLGENVIIHLEIDKTNEVTTSEVTTSPKTVMIKEIQRDPPTHNLLHIDFQQILLTKKIEVSVPLQIVGEAIGVKNGGIFGQQLWELKVRCLPKEIPQVITVDVSNLEISKSLLVKDIVIPKEIDILQNLEQVVATVTPAPVVTEEVVAPLTAEVTEPEVIGKGKKEEEEVGEVEEKETKKEVKKEAKKEVKEEKK